MGEIRSVHQKVSSSTGKTGTKKRDGYAAGRVPESMIGTKVGKTPGKGYSGPNVAQVSGRS